MLIFSAEILSNWTKQLLFALCYAIFEVFANFFSPSVWRFAFKCLKWDWWRINFTNLPFIFFSFVYWDQHHDGLSLSLQWINTCRRFWILILYSNNLVACIFDFWDRHKREIFHWPTVKRAISHSLEKEKWKNQQKRPRKVEKRNK